MPSATEEEAGASEDESEKLSLRISCWVHFAVILFFPAFSQGNFGNSWTWNLDSPNLHLVFPIWSQTKIPRRINHWEVLQVMKEADLYEDVTWQMSFWVFAFDLFDSSDFLEERFQIGVELSLFYDLKRFVFKTVWFGSLKDSGYQSRINAIRNVRHPTKVCSAFGSMMILIDVLFQISGRRSFTFSRILKLTRGINISIHLGEHGKPQICSTFCLDLWRSLAIFLCLAVQQNYSSYILMVTKDPKFEPMTIEIVMKSYPCFKGSCFPHWHENPVFKHKHYCRISWYFTRFVELFCSMFLGFRSWRNPVV